MRGVNKHFQRFDSICLQGTMEDEESSESEAALDLISGQLINLYTGQVSDTPVCIVSRTAAVGNARICLNPRARTLLPRLVNHL